MNKSAITSFAISLLFFVTPVAAQTIEAHASEPYGSPAAALGAAQAYDLYVPFTGVTVNAIHPVSVTMPGMGGGTYLTWMLDRSAFNTDACTVPDAGVPAPVYWTGTDSCGGGLGSPTVHTEATFTALQTWINANLSTQQQQTMVVTHAVGVQRSNVKWWVTFQVGQAFCN